jgi:hypothetical protein
VDKWQAIDRLLAVVPEFTPDYEESVGHPAYDHDGDLLLHLVMGDLGRFYMLHARPNGDLAMRYWQVIEELAATGDEGVQNAVHVSLVEWFAWGDDAEQAALAEAERLQGAATRVMVQAYRPRASESRRSDRRRKRRSRGR